MTPLQIEKIMKDKTEKIFKKNINFYIENTGPNDAILYIFVDGFIRAVETISINDNEKYYLEILETMLVEEIIPYLIKE